MPHVTAVRYLTNYQLGITFGDGCYKIVDLKDHLVGPIFTPLRNIEYFKTVSVHPDLDTIYWDNGADLAPEFLLQLGR